MISVKNLTGILEEIRPEDEDDRKRIKELLERIRTLDSDIFVDIGDVF